jgi:flagellar protein FliO/FliZ
VKSPLVTVSGWFRWLTGVAGCALVATAQRLHAADPVGATRLGDTVLYPAGGATAQGLAPQAAAGTPATWVFVLLVGLAAGGMWLWRRLRPGPVGRRGTIQIEDTRPLGNRQFLVVASCDGRRFLLGVAAGGIQLLSPLDSHDDLDDANKA